MYTEYIVEVFNDVSFCMPTVGIMVAFVLAMFLLFVSAFASGSEIAFFSLSPSDVAEIESSRSSRDEKIKQLREDSERTLATILITNNFVNVSIILLFNYALSHVIHFGEKAYWLEFLCITIILTFLLLLFGEIMPKVFSRQSPLRFCRKAVGGILFLRKLFWPIESLLLRSGLIAEKVVRKESLVLSVDELEQALDLTDKEEIKDERSILKGIVRFGDETAKEVMTSRQDIVDISISSSFDEVLKCIVENNYSRIPVFHDNVDDIKGILYIKDLLPHLGKPVSFRWQSIIRPAFFIPETKKLDDLMREFQDNKLHIAIVVDEYGGTSGLITLEDILEEIVGEINDEFDEEESLYSQLNYNTYIFDGRIQLIDFCKTVNIDENIFANVQGEADTLAGLLLELKGDFPSIREIINYSQFRFEIIEIEERRISKVKVTISN